MRYVLFTALLLAGCAPQVVAGNERGGVVNTAYAFGGYFAPADAYCRQYGLQASIKGRYGPEIHFDCL
jgi:putative hemolysin